MRNTVLGKRCPATSISPTESVEALLGCIYCETSVCITRGRSFEFRLAFAQSIEGEIN